MRIIFLLMACAVIASGCASSVNEGPGQAGDYQVDLLIGQKRETVIKAAEKIFGKPKQVEAIFENSEYEVERRRYPFTNVSDFVMYFHRSVFVQAGLMPVDSPEYPPLRSDFQSITADQPGPVLGYALFMSNHEVIVDTIHPKP